MDDEDTLAGIRRGWARRLASTGRAAGAAARLAARRAVGSQPGQADGDIAAALAHELQQMKGMAMKVGQILSYFEGVLPPEAHRALQSLQADTQPLAFEVIAEVVQEAFGAPVDGLFEDFERHAVAAASIGQVHRARHEGRQVAVKVQYPGVRETVEADFAQLGRIASLASVATQVDGAALVRELKARFVEECDYELEAQHQARFGRDFSGDTQVRVPEVVFERTRRHVLTSTWAEGERFYDFCDAAPASRRNQAAAVLVRFAFESLFRLGRLNADPHPGNYLFADDGGVVFLDYGCVRQFDPDFVAKHRALTQVLLDGRRDGFESVLIDYGVVPRPERFDFDYHWRMLRHAYAPYLSPHFEFTATFVRQGMQMNGPTNPNARHMALPPQSLWVERLLWGLHAVLAKLGASGDFRALLLEPLEASPAPGGPAPPG